MRIGRFVLAGLMALLLLAVGVAAVVPGLLDWNRYRSNIEQLASSGLGRPVQIEGDVTLRLLPQPVLLASGITVADTGDGITMTARALRLRVALGPLLAGRVDARELTLQGADLRLPWPPSPGALLQRPPSWLTGLHARIEDGRLQVGQQVFASVNASVATDPDTGTLSAAGRGEFKDCPWHFTARLARPGRDGQAGLELTLDGQGKLLDTGGSFTGQLGPDGALSGRVSGRGPDLSQVLAAPAQLWKADGRVQASTTGVVADDLALELGGSPARGAVVFRSAPKPQLDLTLSAVRLDLDAWVAVLLRGASSALPTRLDLSAEAAPLWGATLHQVRGGFDLMPGGVTVRSASAILPGDATLSFNGRLQSADAPGFAGSGHLAAPDLRSTLRWLQTRAPGVLASVPEVVLHSADVGFTASIVPGQAVTSKLQGRIDDTRVDGTVGATLGARAAWKAALVMDRLVIDPWLALPTTLPPASTLSDLRRRVAGLDGELKLDIGKASWGGLPLGAVSLDADAVAGAITLRRLRTSVAGVELTTSGALAADGRLSNGRIEASARDLATLAAFVPPDLARLRLLLHDSGSMQLWAAGPPEALALRLNVEAGDLRVEAQPTLNLPARRWNGPVTLHHPGATRLLGMIGVTGTPSWLGDGSFSVLAQLNADPDRVGLESFDIAAGALRMTGQGAMDIRGTDRVVSGRIVAETLAVPAPQLRSSDPLAFDMLRGWRGAVRVEAAHVLAQLAPVFDHMSADVALEDGVARVDHFTAALGDGTVQGALSISTASEPPDLSAQAKFSSITLSGPVFGTEMDVVDGKLDGQFDLTASGHSPATLLATVSGSVQATVQDGIASGFDLAAAAAALEQSETGQVDTPQVLASVTAALSGGMTPFARLRVPVQIRQGTLAIKDSALAGPFGQAGLSGTIDLVGNAAGLNLSLRPALPQDAAAERPDLGLRLSGSLDGLTKTVELAAMTRWLAERPAPTSPASTSPAQTPEGESSPAQ